METIDVYTRVSKLKDERARSTERQEAVCRSRLTAAGYRLGLVLSDPGRSAWNPRVRRPGWEELMSRLESGASNGVIVYDIERFSRQPIDGERLISAAANGLAVLDSDGKMDLRSASGKKSFRDAMAAAAYYSDRLKDRVTDGKALKASKGEVDRRRSFGFESDGVTQRADEVAVIRDCAARLLAGETQDSIIGSLKRTGVPTVSGAAWGYTSFRRIMTRPRNTGLITHKGEVVPGVRLPGEPILNDDTHHRLVALYAARRPGRQPSGRYLLTGLTICAACGSALSGRPTEGRKQYHCKSCRRTYVDAMRLDEWAGDFAIRTLSDPQHADAIEREAAEHEAERQRLTAEAAGIESVLLEVAGRLGRQEIPLQRYDAIAKPLDARLGEIGRELAGLAVEMAPVAGRTLPERDRNWLAVLERWDSGSPGERRAMVQQALGNRRMVIGPGKPQRFDPERVTVG